MTGLLEEMFPPNLRLLWIKHGLWTSVLQTVAMASNSGDYRGRFDCDRARASCCQYEHNPFAPDTFAGPNHTGDRTLLTPNIVVLLVLLIAW